MCGAPCGRGLPEKIEGLMKALVQAEDHLRLVAGVVATEELRETVMAWSQDMAKAREDAGGR